MGDGQIPPPTSGVAKDIAHAVLLVVGAVLLYLVTLGGVASIVPIGALEATLIVFVFAYFVVKRLQEILG